MKYIASCLKEMNKSILRITIIIILLMTILLSACSSSKSTSTTIPLPTSQQNVGYPAPQTDDTVNSSYPGPTSPSSSNPTPTKVIDPQMGIIRGRLLRTNVPIPDISLYLATVMKDNNGNDIVAGLDLSKAETATTAQDGSFTFSNVPLGRYGLVLDIVNQQYLLSYPDKEEAIIMQIEAGKEINLGDLNYDELPLP
jgi:hypothetical protein